MKPRLDQPTAGNIAENEAEGQRVSPPVPESRPARRFAEPKLGPVRPVTQPHLHARPAGKPGAWDFRARGEPFVWSLGGAMCLAVLMIVGFIAFVVCSGILTFYPTPIYMVKLKDGKIIAGTLFRTESFKPGPEVLANLDEQARRKIAASKGFVVRDLYRTANYDLYGHSFRWIPEYDLAERSTPHDLYYFERLEWGPFIGRIKSLDLNGSIVSGPQLTPAVITKALDAARKRRDQIHHLTRKELGAINYYMEKERLALRKAEMKYMGTGPQCLKAKQQCDARMEKLQTDYADHEKDLAGIETQDGKFTITMADINGREKTVRLSEIVRAYPANTLSFVGKVGVYFSRWWEFLSTEPRASNTEGGVLPAIFGTLCMTVLLALAVAPFGVVTALYLREYAKQGKIVSLVRICVNNLAGVPSIVYGVFGLGFFAYILGGTIDELFYPERLPNPTFGTGGLLWASLTLALLTVPVVIVATEEALAAVPQSMREGSLACGASKWQTIKYIVLPRAMPGIMTGLILAMARGAEEVAPLMLVGVVKLAPMLPVDGFFPFIHLERSFMHLGFHIFDVGFQSPDAEAARPMVYVTTFLLISLVFAMNAASIMVRNRLKKKFLAGHF